MTETIADEGAHNKVSVRGATQFAKAPIALLTDTRLSAQSRIVYLMIRSYADESNPGKLPFPSQEKLAERLGIVPRTVARCLDQLIEHGWAQVFHEKRSGGGWPVNHYQLEAEQARGETTEMSGCDPTEMSGCNVTRMSDEPESVYPESVYPEKNPPSSMSDTQEEEPSRLRDEGVETWLEEMLATQPRTDGVDCLKNPNGPGWVTEEVWRVEMAKNYGRPQGVEAVADTAVEAVDPFSVTGPGSNDDMFCYMWAYWPNKTGQRAAWNALTALRRRSGRSVQLGLAEAVKRAAEASREHGTTGKVWKLANFIEKGEWEDWQDCVPEGTHLVKGQTAKQVVNEIYG
jgi:hypothetical protein